MTLIYFLSQSNLNSYKVSYHKKILYLIQQTQLNNPYNIGSIYIIWENYQNCLLIRFSELILFQSTWSVKMKYRVKYLFMFALKEIGHSFAKIKKIQEHDITLGCRDDFQWQWKTCRDHLIFKRKKNVPLFHTDYTWIMEYIDCVIVYWKFY